MFYPANVNADFRESTRQSDQSDASLLTNVLPALMSVIKVGPLSLKFVTKRQVDS